MMTSTIYEVKIRYSVDGKAAGGVQGVTDEVRQLGRETGRVTGLFTKMGAAVVGAFGVSAGAKALIGFNATVQDTKLQIGGMFALARHTGLKEQLGDAGRLFARLQKDAATLPGTTSEYTRMAGMLTQPIIDAGLGMNDLVGITEAATVGAKALGYQWDLAARDIDQALRGQFHSTDPFAGKILGSAGFKGEEGRAKFNSMDAGARAETLRSALMQKGMLEMAEAQGQTFNGMLSTLQDTIEQFFGKVGLPLFKAITVELKSWNTWFDGNQAKVDAFAAKFADGLVTGFRAVKDALSFLVEHADMLMMLAKVWAGVKLGGMLAGAGGGLMGAIGRGGGALAWARGSRDGGSEAGGTFFGGGYQFSGGGAGRQKAGWKDVAGSMGGIGQSLSAGFAIGTVLDQLTGNAMSEGFKRLVGVTDETTDKFYEIQRSMDALDDATRRAARPRARRGWPRVWLSPSSVA